MLCYKFHVFLPARRNLDDPTSAPFPFKSVIVGWLPTCPPRHAQPTSRATALQSMCANQPVLPLSLNLSLHIWSETHPSCINFSFKYNVMLRVVYKQCDLHRKLANFWGKTWSDEENGINPTLDREALSSLDTQTQDSPELQSNTHNNQYVFCVFGLHSHFSRNPEGCSSSG